MKKLLFISFFIVSLAALAQKPADFKKAYKPIRAALKAKKPTDALTVINKLAADTIYNRDPKLYAFGIDAELLLCESFNEKMYLGQKIDTAQFFQANRDLCRFILRCDTAGQRLLELATAKPNPKKSSIGEFYRRQNRQLLHQYYPNLSAAARFHYSKKQFAEARKYFALYFSLPHHPIWGTDSSAIATKTFSENIYLDFRAMFELKQYDEMQQFADTLLADSALHEQVLDMLVTAAQGRGDTVAYYKLVNQGLAENPDRLDYFAILTNYHTERGDYEAALALANTLLQRDSINRYYLQSRCLSLFKLNRLEESRVAAERLAAVDTTAAEAQYVLAHYYVQQAELVKLPRQTRSALYKSAKRRQAELFAKARGHAERLRALQPEDRERWAPFLYKIYLNLNLGKEFEEIQRLVGDS